MPQRIGFVLEVKPDRVDEYVRAHREVWPEMLAALKDAGVRNYTIFRAGTQMFGYFETDELARTESYLAAHEANVRWQHAMAPLLEERVADRGPTPLEEIFRLA